ncbi:tRNA methyltransferase complex GCD14 subunit-domain-containing protein [Kalaharituber pfeilii]|nr:tRNA methyltransferase complex GCD14 subunit-domain-containing protein [Kalaharituber pfeilii]
MATTPPPPHAPSPYPSILLHPPTTILPSPTPHIIHLRRDHLLPLVLNPFTASRNETLNTRFGHFPHRTLLHVPSGAQVKSSLVGAERRKRKRDGEGDGQDDVEDAVGTSGGGGGGAGGGDAPWGFIHVLAPTPELWTMSLPHRTQVVYTADSSYIIHRLRVGPGTHIIEAGAGSGSFTHAAVRSIYSGYPNTNEDLEKGKVFSYEYHATRAEKLRVEVKEHGLEGLVEITHGDVCKDGFRLQRGRDKRNQEKEGQKELVDGVQKMDVDGGANVGGEEMVEGEVLEESPEATAVFLDLPAPWLAIPHLTRNRQVPTIPLPIPSLVTPTPLGSTSTPASSTPPPPEATNQTVTSKTEKAWGPLHPTLPVHICTFSPCIEQIHRTVSVLRKLSWIDVEMVEVQHRKLEVRRQKPGGMPGADGAYGNVEEAVSKLKGIVGWRKRPIDESGEKSTNKEKERTKKGREFAEEEENPIVITRLEPELKTHTSYLLFATLPPQWTATDEEAAKQRVETDKLKFIVERENNGVSTWKKEKEKKKGKYGPPPGQETEGSESKGMSRKERKKLERAERYRKGKMEQEQQEKEKEECASEEQTGENEKMEIG